MPEELKFTPLSNYIVLEIIKKKPKKEGLLYIPETAELPFYDSTVIKVSEDKDNEGRPLVRNVKAGDKVVFSSHSAIELNIWGKKYVVIRENEVIGILEAGYENELEDYTDEPKKPVIHTLGKKIN